MNDCEPEESEIWHPFWLLEEVAHNMCGNVNDRKDWLSKAIDFTANHHVYGHWMLKVAEEWRYSCEHNLTKSGDKRPWIGHAAVAMAIQCPEDIVREAWGHLTEEQQTLANDKAREAIEYWRSKNA